jgi:uncharacterized BrkB/YihY/UPF0761 family membrane protein
MQKSEHMLYFVGYIVGCFSFVTGLGMLMASLHRRSSFHTQYKVVKIPPLIKSRALISFSIILPFTALSFLILTFPAMKIAQNQGQQGHLYYVMTSLFIPTVCFLIGFHYFRKAVRP